MEYRMYAYIYRSYQCLYTSLGSFWEPCYGQPCVAEEVNKTTAGRWQEAHQIQKGQSSWDGTVSERMKLEVAYLGPLAHGDPR